MADSKTSGYVSRCSAQCRSSSSTSSSRRPAAGQGIAGAQMRTRTCDFGAGGQCRHSPFFRTDPARKRQPRECLTAAHAAAARRPKGPHCGTRAACLRSSNATQLHPPASKSRRVYKHKECMCASPPGMLPPPASAHPGICPPATRPFPPGTCPFRLGKGVDPSTPPHLCLWGPARCRHRAEWP